MMRNTLRIKALALAMIIIASLFVVSGCKTSGLTFDIKREKARVMMDETANYYLTVKNSTDHEIKFRAAIVWNGSFTINPFMSIENKGNWDAVGAQMMGEMGVPLGSFAFLDKNYLYDEHIIQAKSEQRFLLPFDAADETATQTKLLSLNIVLIGQSPGESYYAFKTSETVTFMPNKYNQ